MQSLGQRLTWFDCNDPLNCIYFLYFCCCWSGTNEKYLYIFHKNRDRSFLPSKIKNLNHSIKKLKNPGYDSELIYKNRGQYSCGFHAQRAFVETPCWSPTWRP